jgi:hypothetical protein
MSELPANIIKREIISQDKDGTLEKVWEQPYDRVTIQEDGTEKIERVEPWEIRATGRKTQELRGAFKDSAPQMLHESAELNRKIGMEKLTLANGSVDEFRADHIDMLRTGPGVGVRRVRPGVVISGFGGMKRAGLIRCRIRYSNGVRTVEEEC